MLQKLKKITIICFLIIISLTALGCASINSVTYIADDGSIVDIIKLKVDSEKISTECDYETVKNDIASYSYGVAYNLLNDYKRQIQATILLETNTQKIIELTSLLDDVKILGNTWEGEYYSIGFSFSSSESYYRLYNYTSTNFNETISKEKFLYTKVMYLGNNSYALRNSLYTDINSYFTNYFDKLDYDCTLLYSYGVDSSRYYSNANYITRQNGKYIHTWIVDKDNLNQELYFYKRVPNKTNWLISCIILGLIFTIIVLIILIINQLINNNKNKTILIK